MECPNKHNIMDVFISADKSGSTDESDNNKPKIPYEE